MPLLSPTPKTADLWQSLTPAPRILTLIILAINTLANLPFSILLSVLCYRSYNNVRIYSDGQKAYPESEYAWDPYAPGTTVGLALAPAILILVLGVVDLVLYARLVCLPHSTLHIFRAPSGCASRSRCALKLTNINETAPTPYLHARDGNPHVCLPCRRRRRRRR